ncbi:hypothetical protein J6590_003890 [Homalodisca vitripennis]|nr:hypothetical protein J6590_003890 [Homalodisca vitripennis]
MWQLLRAHDQSNKANSTYDMKRVQRLSQDNQIKPRRACQLLGWVTAERSCPVPACPAIDGGSEATFRPRLSVKEGFLALT